MTSYTSEEFQEMAEARAKEAKEKALEEAAKNIDPKRYEGDKKAPMQYLPLQALESVSKVLKLGSDKYGERNWINYDGVGIHTYKGAILRHLTAIDNGVDYDDESNQLHLAHIVASCLIMIDASLNGKLIDTRILPLKKEESNSKPHEITNILPNSKPPKQIANSPIKNTNPIYWDCKCDDHYIHHKAISLKCNKCGAIEAESSGSRIDEVASKELWRFAIGSN